MKRLMLFTDGSAHPQLKIGYGAYLIVSSKENSPDSLKSQVKTKRFEQTTSVKLELQTLLWALGEIETSEKDITVYTDSQNIVRLLERRFRLEQSNYYSAKNKRINNYELYQEFYRTIDKLNCQFEKVRGHRAQRDKNYIEKLFELVDRASRSELRKEATKA